MGRQKWNEKEKNGEKCNEIQYDCERNICSECKKKKKKNIGENSFSRLFIFE